MAKGRRVQAQPARGDVTVLKLVGAPTRALEAFHRALDAARVPVTLEGNDGIYYTLGLDELTDEEWARFLEVRLRHFPSAVATYNRRGKNYVVAQGRLIEARDGAAYCGSPS